MGSAYDPDKDQELESILVGPIPVGLNKIVFQTDAPKTDLIDSKDLLGPTVVLLTCSFMDQEFIRIGTACVPKQVVPGRLICPRCPPAGYYVNNEYENPDWNDNPPELVDINSMVRNILHDSPRVTRFDINWNGPEMQTENVDSMDASGWNSMHIVSAIRCYSHAALRFRSGWYRVHVGRRGAAASAS